ncbi:MAG: glycosyltransferase [Actinobacteria bacterium]|nr:glycosyltransferase [Actinomycetota bacterium]
MGAFVTRLQAHVFLSAYACHPVDGSEPGVGWQVLSAALAEVETVTVLTRQNNIDAVAGALAAADADRCHVVGYDLPRLFTYLKKRLPAGTQLYYMAWQFGARRVVRRVDSQRAISIAHHVTFAVDWMPTCLGALRADVPVIWGPVGGATTGSVRSLWLMGFRGALADVPRVVAAVVGRRLFGLREASHASIIIAQNPTVAGNINRHANKILVEPNAFIPADFRISPSLPSPDPAIIRLIGVGRISGFKGWRLAVQVVARLPDNYELDIYGAGPDLPRLRHYIKRRGLESRVRLRGWASRPDVLQAVANASCFIHPSFHDSAPGVLAEAISVGVPCVVLGVSGSAYMASLCGGLVVDPAGRDLPGRFAKEVMACRPPTDIGRFGVHRLPGLLRQWYELASSGTLTDGN